MVIMLLDFEGGRRQRAWPQMHLKAESFTNEVFCVGA